MRLSRRSMLVAAIVLAVALAGVGGFFALYDTTSSTRVAGGGTRVVAVALVDAPVGFDVTPDVVTVDPGTRLVLEVVNKAGEVHDLAVRNGPHTRMLSSGQSQRLDLGLVTSRLDAWCTIPGHKTGGMTLDLRVAGAAAAPTTPAGLAHPPGVATTPEGKQMRIYIPVAQSYKAALVADGISAISFAVEDVQAEFQRLSGPGVRSPRSRSSWAA